MAPETPLPTSEEVSQSLHDNIHSALTKRLCGERPLLVGLSPPLAHHALQDPEIMDLDWAMLYGRLGDGRFLRLEQVLREPLMSTLRTYGLLDWGAARLPVLAVSACRVAGRLLEQLGRDDPGAMDLGRIPSGFEAILRNCLRRASGSRGPVMDAYAGHFTTSLLERVDGYISGLERNLRLLRLHSEAGTIVVDWITADGKSVRHETLHDLLEAVVGPLIADLTRHIGRGDRTPHELQQRGIDILTNVCPGLAEAVQLATGLSTCVGLRLCTVPLRAGIPLDVWMYVGPHPGWPGHACTLSLHRAHHEFILGAIDGQRYYFPPCLLIARLAFSEGRPIITRPTVRQPAGGFLWRHPYTGDLGGDPFEGAELLHAEADAMYEPSKQAIRLFPQLKARTSTACEGNMCLDGQTVTMKTVQNRFLETPAGQGDVLADLTALHDIVRLGLTRGHQNNTAGPRAKLGPVSMPYPIQGRKVTGALARRVFAYAGNRVVSA